MHHQKQIARPRSVKRAALGAKNHAIQARPGQTWAGAMHTPCSSMHLVTPRP